MKIIRAILSFCASVCITNAQSLNPLSIFQTSPTQFRLDWTATNQSRFQVEGSPDLYSWAKVGPVVIGTGASQTMLVSKTVPNFFYKLSKGGLRPGFDEIEMSKSDDHTYPEFDAPASPVPLGFTINFFGESFDECFVNNNGNITFEQPLGDFRPESLNNLNTRIIAPFWADVDTQNMLSDVTRFSSPPSVTDGRPAFGVTYKNVGYYAGKGDKLNRFQVILIERSDTGAGNFDIEFNFEKIIWETGDAGGGNMGISGISARVGFSNGKQSFAEIAGSGIPSSFLDSNSTSGLANRSYGSNVPGRFVFPFRNGSLENSHVVNAGQDRTLLLSDNGLFQLSGSVIPANIPGIAYKWTETTPPPYDNDAVFSSTTILNPNVSISGLGPRTFRLVASLAGIINLSIADEVIISNPTLNVDAGEDIEISAPTSLSVTLNGTASFSEGGAVSVEWTQLYGDDATISNSAILNPIVTLPGPGIYVFELIATSSHSPPFEESDTIVITYTE